MQTCCFFLKNFEMSFDSLMNVSYKLKMTEKRSEFDVILTSNDYLNI